MTSAAAPGRPPSARADRAVPALAALLLAVAPGPLAAQHADGAIQGRGASEALIRGVDAPEATGIVDLPRLRGPVTVDGPSDEAAWAGIEPLPLTMYQPTFRGTSDRDIEVLVAYDDAAIYVAGRFRQDPDDIRAFSYTRDQYGGDDGFAVILDTFNDNENALRFTGLPLGTRMDHAIDGDGQGPGPGNLSWNTYWDYETVITDEGWFGEIRIPFSSLRFRTAPDGSVVMGLLGFAYQSAVDSRWTWPAMDNAFPYQKVSSFQKVRLRDIEPTNPVYVTPYVLAASTREAELVPEGTAFGRAGGGDWEVGGDVKLTPTPNLTLDLTVNTDFAAVEADQQQVNLTRFSLFFEEKRPFFQERAGIFGFDTGADRGTLFYSRRIGLADGRPVRLLGGARLVGRLGGWDLGVIEMQTGGEGELPGENFGVVRARRSVVNDWSYVGGMATSRVANDGAYNVTYGLDGQLRAWGDEYLTLKWLQTFQGGSPLRDAAASGLDAGRVVLDWTRRRQEGLAYRHALVWSGPGFDPAVGFDPRSDFTRLQSDWDWYRLPGQGSPLRRVWLGSRANVWVRNADDRVDTGEIEPFVQVESGRGTSVKLSTRTSYEDVAETFDLSDEAWIPAGTYWATEGALEMRAARAWPVRPNVTLTAGQFFDGTRFGIKADTELPLGRHLSVNGGWEWNRIRLPERGQAFDATLLRLTVRTALDTRLSLFVFGQYSDLTGAVTTNTRLRYNFREGQDLWLVWNEGLNVERTVVGLPRLPLEQVRTLTVKYTHTLVF